MSRIINIMLTELASDVMKYEEAMETTINSKEDINTKVENIKKYLAKIVETERMIEKWRTYTQSEVKTDDELNV